MARPHRVVVVACTTLLLLASQAAAAAPQCVQHTAAEGLVADWHYSYKRDHKETSILRDILREGNIAPYRSSPPPACGVLELVADPFEGEFYLAPDNHVVFEPDHCTLRRLSADAARQCLTGRHVAFVGDSVSRYQYLQLAVFLTSKRHIPRYHEAKGPSLMNWHEWPDMNVFYNKSNSALSSAVDATAAEACDCLRTHDMETSYEYRRLVVCLGGQEECSATDGARPPPQIVLRYQQAFRYPDPWTDSIEGIDAVLADEVPPDVLIYNMGLHVPPETPLVELIEGFTRVFRHARDAIKRRGLKTQLVWKSMSLPQNKREERGRINTVGTTLARLYGWRVYDVWALHEQGEKTLSEGQLKWDANHFYAYVYQELSDVLLNALCDADCGYALGRTFTKPAT